MTVTTVARASSSSSPVPQSGGTSRAALLLAKTFWFVLTPGLIAVLAVWTLLDAPIESLAVGSFEGWLRDQTVLVWLVVFVLVSSLLQYWKQRLPPIRLWQNEQPATSRSLDLRTTVQYALVIALAGCAALALRMWIAEPCKVRTSSMVPTLYPGDQLMVSKLSRAGSPLSPGAPAPKRGNVILFATPDPALRELDAQLFKRVVGLPGDVLSIQRGTVVINGWKVPRCGVGRVSLQLANMDAPVDGFLSVERLGDATYLTLAEGLADEANQGPYTVKAGEIWVLGDNRNNSSDSRSWFNGKGGGVPFADVIGTPAWTFYNAARTPSLHFERVELARLPPSAESLRPAFEHCLAERPSSLAPPEPPKL